MIKGFVFFFLPGKDSRATHSLLLLDSGIFFSAVFFFSHSLTPSGEKRFFFQVYFFSAIFFLWLYIILWMFDDSAPRFFSHWPPALLGSKMQVEISKFVADTWFYHQLCLGMLSVCARARGQVSKIQVELMRGKPIFCVGGGSLTRKELEEPLTMRGTSTRSMKSMSSIMLIRSISCTSLTSSTDCQFTTSLYTHY